MVLVLVSLLSSLPGHVGGTLLIDDSPPFSLVGFTSLSLDSNLLRGRGRGVLVFLAAGLFFAVSSVLFFLYSSGFFLFAAFLSRQTRSRC